MCSPIQLGTPSACWSSSQKRADLPPVRRQAALPRTEIRPYADPKWKTNPITSRPMSRPGSGPSPVEAFVGHRVTGWPFARFDISSSELRVRLSFPWFTTRSQQATAIRAVTVTRRFGSMYWIGFYDANGSLRDVRIHPIYCRQEIIDELRP
jgi:hypothetical protein